MASHIDAVFFDLDGTLLDTAPDIATALNRLLARYEKPPVDFETFRYQVHGGAATMLNFAFQVETDDPRFDTLKTEFIALYQENMTAKTVFFEGIEATLNALDAQNTAWGIITNKPSFLTDPLLEHFDLHQRTRCAVSGDTLPVCKPYPDPLLFACQLTEIDPTRAVYVGDTEGDVIAAKAAGMKSMAVTYGYHQADADPRDWKADVVIDSAQDMVNWLNWMRTEGTLHA